jgi:hypothetical protein
MVRLKATGTLRSFTCISSKRYFCSIFVHVAGVLSQTHHILIIRFAVKPDIHTSIKLDQGEGKHRPYPHKTAWEVGVRG